MELPEANDPKMELLKKSTKHRQELEEDVRMISERTEKIITNALIVGGTLAAAYFLVRQFSGSKQKRKANLKKIKAVEARPEEPGADAEEESSQSMVSQIGTALASQLAIFLLGIAKEKLTEYLQSQFEKKSKDNERS